MIDENELRRALADPDLVFSAPEEVAERSDVSIEEQRAILRAWESQVRSLLVAEDENMRAGPSEHYEELLQRIVIQRLAMQPVESIKRFLDDHAVKYTFISHSPAYSAQEIAELVHISGHGLAKTVVVEIDDKKAMVVLPASARIQLGNFKKTLGVSRVCLANEADFRSLFPGCEIGAMPPFGNLYGMDVYLSERLTQGEEIVFNAGSHSQLIRMTYNDYAALVQPHVLLF